jgi:hypothetical protein
MKAHSAIALGYLETVRGYSGDRGAIGIDVDEKSHQQRFRPLAHMPNPLA